MIEIIDVTRKVWNSQIALYSEANFLQSWQWGELYQSLGDVVVRRGIKRDGQLVGMWQGIIKNARRGRYLEVPGGPLIDWTNLELTKEIVADMRRIAKEQQCVFVRIRPQLLDSDEHRTLLTNVGFRHAPFHLHAEHTNILHLTSSQEELLAGMRRQTRYEVRRSTKQDIEVSLVSGEKAIEQFYQVQSDTAARQGFVPSSKQFLLALAKTFGDNLKVYQSVKDGMLLNMALVVWSGEEADYYEAASTPESRKFAGAYGLQWQAICDAKAAGKTRYNFWGIAYSNDPHHRYAGVTTFKRGFGGDDITYVPAHDLVLHPTYLKNWLIETARRKKRRL